MSSKRLVPLFDRVLIRKLQPQKTTVGGIVLPESATKKVNQGTVVAVGPGARDREGRMIPMSVKPGDNVLLSEFGGTEVELAGEELALYREDEILGKLE
ncbi:10 kDa chaperonin [Balamuthia mandrillaris]